MFPKYLSPEIFDFDLFFKGMYHQHEVIQHHKYANNYDYNKVVYLMSEFDILENGFLIIKEDKSYAFTHLPAFSMNIMTTLLI